MDAFPSSTGSAGAPKGYGKNIVMGYYDGNTVTALWNYAQHFALNDNSWTTTFGPSTPGALNLISGQTDGIDAMLNVVDESGKLLHPSNEVKDGDGNYTVIGDTDPLLDACSKSTRPGDDARPEHRRSAQRQGCLLGLVHGRIRSDDHQSQWHERLRAVERDAGAGRVPGRDARLHPAPRMVPVLRLDAKRHPCASEVDGGHRPYPRPAHR